MYNHFIVITQHYIINTHHHIVKIHFRSWTIVTKLKYQNQFIFMQKDINTIHKINIRISKNGV